MKLKTMGRVLVLILMGAMGGCEGYSRLTHPQGMGTARLSMDPLPAETTPAGGGGQAETPRSENSVTGMGNFEAPVPPLSAVQGTYSFVTPPEVTRVKRTTESYEQYQLYWGQPSPNDTPFLTIWVGKEPPLEVDRPGSNLRADNARSYICNELATREWTGYTTNQRLPFVELTMKRPGAGDTLHAVAIANSNSIRQATLDILGTVKWEPKN